MLVTLSQKRRKKTAIDLSLEDVKKGRVTTYKSTKDFFDKILG